MICSMSWMRIKGICCARCWVNLKMRSNCGRKIQKDTKLSSKTTSNGLNLNTLLRTCLDFGQTTNEEKCKTALTRKLHKSSKYIQFRNLDFGFWKCNCVEMGFKRSVSRAMPFLIHCQIFAVTMWR